MDGAGLRGEKRRKLCGEALMLRLDWWNVTIKIGKEMCPDEKWDDIMP